MMEKLRLLATHPFVILMFGAVTATGGFFTNDFLNWRNEARTVERSAFDQSQAVTKDLQAVLTQFASIAEGKTLKTAPDVERVRTVLLNDQESAKNLVRLEPSAKPLLAKFERSALAVLVNAEKLDGPLTAKPMAEAVGDYLYARDQLHTAVSASFSKYL